MTTMRSSDDSARNTASISRFEPLPPADPALVSAHSVERHPERSRVRSALVLLALLGIAAAVAAFGSIVSALAIEGWYVDTPKPLWNPPNAVFGPVWTVLYVLMSVAAWLVWRRPDSGLRTSALRVYGLQLAVNAIWSPVFFGLGALIGAPGVWIALGVIVVLDFAILATIIRFNDVNRIAAALLVPYWLWALFATTLNAAIAVLAR